MPILNTPTSLTETFPLPTTTTTGRFGIQINPESPSTAPNVVDYDGNVIATWSSSLNNFVPLDPSLTVGTDNTTIGAFLNQNSNTLRNSTIRIIDRLPDAQRNAFFTSSTFSPYNTWRTTQGTAPPAGGDQRPTPDPIDLNQEIADDTNFLRRNYGTHYYPSALEDNKQDRIKFTMVRYGNRPLSFTGNTINPFEGSRRNLTQILGSVFLPIQSGIGDSNNVEWGGERLDALTATAASLALAGMNIDAQGNITQQVGDLLGAGKAKILKSLQGGGLEALKLYLTQEALSTNGILSRVTGGIVNPNLELLFAGPQLRPFNFTFKLSPRSQPEATQVRNIIRFFKQGMSVKVASNDIFLKAPNVFDITYESFDPFGNRIIDHPSIGQIKTCALTGFDVNYTPDGSYMTFNDNERTMTSYEISMRFSELEPVTERDIYPINENHIGY